MNMEAVLSVLGIALNTVGIILIFLFGLSPLVDTGGPKMLYRESVMYDRNSKQNKKKRLYFRLAVTGLLLCVAGNIFQTIGIYLHTGLQ